MTALDLLKIFIRFFEGLRLRAYLCPAGIWTCGYGSTGPDIKPGITWTKERAEERMEEDAQSCLLGAARVSPGLLQNKELRAAVADFVYNLGLSRYKASTLRRRLDRGDVEGALIELKKWVWGGGRKLPGLVRRRQAEVDLVKKHILPGKDS